MVHKILTNTDDEYENGFVRDPGKKDSRTKGDHDAERNHMHMMVRLRDLFCFVNYLEKVIRGSGKKYYLKEKC